MSESTGLEQFLEEIAPIFYRRPVTYVDVRAYDGRVFEKVLVSDLAVDEAHLIEPNDHFLGFIRTKRADSFHGRNVAYYPLAVEWLQDSPVLRRTNMAFLAAGLRRAIHIGSLVNCTRRIESWRRFARVRGRSKFFEARSRT